MRVPRFYFSGDLSSGARVALGKDAAHHAVRVLRMNEGDAVSLFNGDDHLYGASIVRINKQEVIVLVQSRASASHESPLQILLAQGIASGERMDFILQKSVELGVSAIQPLQTERSVVKLQGERKEKRAQHWQNMVNAACEQCGRNVIPQVLPILDLPSWLGQTATLTHPPQSGAASTASPGLRVMLSPRAEPSLRSLPTPQGLIHLTVGPEGGFSAQEETALLHCGYTAARLGPRVLRTETASLAALAAMQTLWGDF